MAGRRERRPNIDASSRLRREPLRVLHRQQIAMLRAWRGLRQDSDDEGATAMLPPAPHRRRYCQRPARPIAGAPAMEKPPTPSWELRAAGE